MTTYRCYYTPKSNWGQPVLSEAGVLPYVQLEAMSAENALRAAHHVTGCPVAEAERLDDVAA